ncbi:MAG: M81 family metallopeptidase [Armatimonadota bacterium]
MGTRIAVGGLWHETNTFAAGRTEVADFGIVEGPAIVSTLGGTRTPLGGYLDAAQRAGVEVVPTFFAFALPSGLVSREALDSIVGRLVALVSEARPDAILLDLHGAMAAEGS